MFSRLSRVFVVLVCVLLAVVLSDSLVCAAPRGRELVRKQVQARNKGQLADQAWYVLNRAYDFAKSLDATVYLMSFVSLLTVFLAIRWAMGAFFASSSQGESPRVGWMETEGVPETGRGLLFRRTTTTEHEGDPITRLDLEYGSSSKHPSDSDDDDFLRLVPINSTESLTKTRSTIPTSKPESYKPKEKKKKRVSGPSDDDYISKLLSGSSSMEYTGETLEVHDLYGGEESSTWWGEKEPVELFWDPELSGKESLVHRDPSSPDPEEEIPSLSDPNPSGSESGSDN